MSSKSGGEDCVDAITLDEGRGVVERELRRRCQELESGASEKEESEDGWGRRGEGQI